MWNVENIFTVSLLYHHSSTMDSNVHTQYSCTLTSQVSAQFLCPTKLLIIVIILEKSAYLQKSKCNFMCSLFFVFTLFYLILENISTNVRQFCFPCKLVNLTSWSISLLPPVVLLYCCTVYLLYCIIYLKKLLKMSRF